MAILKRSNQARIALERVGIMLEKPPPPPPPPKIEVGYEELANMDWNQIKEEQRDDFKPSDIYNVGEEDSDDNSIFNYFNPKQKKGQRTGMSTKTKTTKSLRPLKSKKNLKTTVDAEYYVTDQDRDTPGNSKNEKSKINSSVKLNSREFPKKLNPLKNQSFRGGNNVSRN